MRNHQGTRRLSRAVALAATVAVCATACGLSQSARTTLGAGSGGGVANTAAESTGGAATSTDPGVTTTDPGVTTADPGTTATDPGTTATDPGTAPTTPGGTATTTTPVGGGTTATGPTSTTPVTGTATTKTGTAPVAGTKTGTSPATTTTTTKKGTSPGTTTTTSSKPGTTAQTSAAPASANCSTGTGTASTGISASTINVGLHAPLTGTGTPFPNSSFVQGSKYFWMDPAHKICNRNVSVDFQDDQYTPTGARNVCSQFAKTDFLAVGGAGTDQIQACATQPDIDSTGTPYLSAGVTQNGLTTLPNYFAVSLSYSQQSSILVKAAKAGGWATPAAASTGGQWAVVTSASDNFKDARVSMEAALQQAGISFKEFNIDQSGNYQASATQMGATLALDGYKTIYDLTAPGYWVFLTGGYYGQAANGGVTWVGPGVSFTDFVVAQLACSGSKNAINGHAFYLAPNPGVDRANAAFKAAAGSGADDIAWGLWGLDELLYQALQKVAPGGLTRQNFINTLQNSSLAGGSDTAATFSNSHFGGTAAWEQMIDCGKTESGQNQAGTWDTVGNAPLTP